MDVVNSLQLFGDGRNNAGIAMANARDGCTATCVEDLASIIEKQILTLGRFDHERVTMQ
jgi:hypothetical protein